MDPVLLTYAGPPVIGAFIGYLTNKIAIRMLFRPLKAWYVFGLRVPMTPGVIPSKRRDLAENIGIMVGEHLLTARDIGTALSMEPFQNHLHALVDTRVKEILEGDLGPVLTIVPKRFRAYTKVGLRTLKYQMKDGVRSYLRSDTFATVFKGVFARQLEQYGQQDLNSLVSAQQRQHAYGFIDDLLCGLLEGPGVEAWLSGYLGERLHGAGQCGKNVEDLLPEPFIDFIGTTLAKQTPELLQGLAGLLAEPRMRDKIIQAVIGGIEQFLNSLGPMAAMAKGFIDMDTLDGKIREYLIEHEDELEQWMQNPEVQERVVALLQKQVDKLMQTPVADILERLEDGQLEIICRSLATQLLGALRTRGTIETLSLLLRQSLEEMLEQGQRSMGSLAGQLFPGENGQQMQETLEKELLAIFRSDGSRRLTGRMVDTMIDTLARRPVGILARLMPAGVRSGISDYIVLTANRMLLQEVPGLVKSLNIRQLVTDKVDSLDLLKLEGLLLSIMEEQFKYINLFGALLGFLIGLINLFLLRLV
jgi:uncharacterized membrane protein YheB (UPF0754 family)